MSKLFILSILLFSFGIANAQTFMRIDNEERSPKSKMEIMYSERGISAEGEEALEKRDWDTLKPEERIELQEKMGNRIGDGNNPEAGNNSIGFGRKIESYTKGFGKNEDDSEGDKKNDKIESETDTMHFGKQESFRRRD